MSVLAPYLERFRIEITTFRPDATPSQRRLLALRGALKTFWPMLYGAVVLLAWGNLAPLLGGWPWWLSFCSINGAAGLVTADALAVLNHLTSSWRRSLHLSVVRLRRGRTVIKEDRPVGPGLVATCEMLDELNDATHLDAVAYESRCWQVYAQLTWRGRKTESWG